MSNHNNNDEEDEISSPDELESESDSPSDSRSLATLQNKLPAGSSNAPATESSTLLQRFMKEVGRHPLLSAEEELELSTRLHQTGDIEAARRLVTANLRLVVKIAFEYRSVYANVMDLVQEGNMGLMKAVSKFDPLKGARFGYYASWWIRSYILKYLLDNFRLVKIGTTQAQKKLFYHLMRERDRLEAQGMLASPKLLAQKLDVDEDEVLEMTQRLGGSDVSLDAPQDFGDEGPSRKFMDTMVDTREDPSTTIEREQLLTMLQTRLPEFKKQLNTKEIQILDQRLLAEEPKTLQEIAMQHGLTRERARQIEVKLIKKLREFLAFEDS